jgi:glycosyltransferase involved in cell wall biosynthesis
MGGNGANKPLKVAYLVNQYPRVSHSFIRREILALEARGIVVERFSVRSSGEELVDPADQAERQRTAVLLEVGIAGLLLALATMAVRRPVRWLDAIMRATRMGWRSSRGILRHWAYAAEACVLVSRLRQRGMVHLHAHFGTNSADVALLTHVLGGPPYSFTIHGPTEFDAPESYCLREKIEGAAFVAAVSEFGRSQVFRWCAPQHWPRVHVVHCGVDAAFLSGDPSPVPDVARLVCVGRLAEAKGQLRLLEALSQLRERGVYFEVVLAGDGPMRAQIEAEIGRRALGDQVRITGWQSSEAVRRHILESRALVLPSFAEGLPVVLMEALGLGRPVITTHVAGIPELVQDGVNGWLVPAGSIEALTDALQQSLTLPIARLTEMGRSGAVRVAGRHDAAREAEKLAVLFQSSAKGDATLQGGG